MQRLLLILDFPKCLRLVLTLLGVAWIIIGEEKLNLHQDTSTETCQQEEIFANINKGIPWGVEHYAEDYLVYQCLQAVVMVYIYIYIIDWVVYNNKYISRSSGGYVRGHGGSRFCVCWQPTFWFIDGHLFTVSTYSRWGQSSLRSFLYKDTVIFMRAYLRDLITYQSPHLHITSHWILGFNI